jgi:hypothetical protein
MCNGRGSAGCFYVEYTCAKENGLGGPGRRNSTGYQTFIAKIFLVLLRPAKYPLSFRSRDRMKEKGKYGNVTLRSH